MDFGRVPETELDEVDFRLPKEPSFNEEVLSGKKAKSPLVYVGCAKWGRTEWVGKIYPPKTKERDFLDHYVKHYNSIELNATHYKIYDAAAIAKWSDKATDSKFKFCPKMNQKVTHFGNLIGKEALVAEFLKGVSAFGEKLGPIFVQLSDRFAPKRKEEVYEFLKSLPSKYEFFFEVRHPEWFANEEVWAELMNVLRDLDMGIVITDTAGRRDCAHMYLSIPKTFIRYVGNSLHPSDYKRIDAWVKRMKKWLDEGMEELYFFMHMHDEATSPELTVYLVDKMNKTCGLDLIKPKFVDANKLFE